MPGSLFPPCSIYKQIKKQMQVGRVERAEDRERDTLLRLHMWLYWALAFWPRKVLFPVCEMRTSSPAYRVLGHRWVGGTLVPGTASGCRGKATVIIIAWWCPWVCLSACNQRTSNTQLRFSISTWSFYSTRRLPCNGIVGSENQSSSILHIATFILKSRGHQSQLCYSLSYMKLSKLSGLA